MTKKNYHNSKVKKLLRELKIMAKKNMEKNKVIKQDYLKKHQDGKETFNTFLLKLQWHEITGQGACLSPPYDAQEQGPLEVTGGKSQGKRHRVCQRVETGSTHKPKDMER